ncbi:MAG: hypothetical protein RIM23_11295 [Coleofasciculus sp. G3-WIS-01]
MNIQFLGFSVNGFTAAGATVGVWLPNSYGLGAFAVKLRHKRW